MNHEWFVHLTWPQVAAMGIWATFAVVLMAVGLMALYALRKAP